MGGEWRLGYRPELDGLRAFAVLLVMLTHAWVTGFDQGGAVGVGVFFVLSGFLITSLLLHESEDTGSIDLRAFWRRRATRLLPLLFLVLTIFSVFELTQYQPDAWGILGIVFYMGNWMSAFGLGILRPLNPAWTLGIEEQFYIVWPLALLALLRWKRLPLSSVLVILVAVGIAWRALVWWVIDNPNWVYFGTDTNAFMLLAGCLLAVLLVQGNRLTLSPLIGWCALGGLVVMSGVPLILTKKVYPLYLGSPQFVIGPIVGTLLAVAVILWLVDSGSAFWRWAPLVFVGRISYGLYLWHMPVFAAWEHNVSPLYGDLWPTLAVFSITFACAVASYFAVERPLMRRFRVSRSADHRGAKHGDLKAQRLESCDPGST